MANDVTSEGIVLTIGGGREEMFGSAELSSAAALAFVLPCGLVGLVGLGHQA